MADFNYEILLKTYGGTLKELSADTSKLPEGSITYLTTSEKQVIDFDKFTHSIAENINPNNRPKSCDVLLKLNDKYYFIEFKNGRIKEKQEGYEIREKILESILLFLEQINKTIFYSRNNCNFILVCNINSVLKGKKQNGLEKITGKLDNLVHLSRYENIYLKRAFVCSVEDFDKSFIEKHCL